jgi:hypothetical protein
MMLEQFGRLVGAISLRTAALGTISVDRENMGLIGDFQRQYVAGKMIFMSSRASVMIE